MYIEDLVDKYPEEITALGIETDIGYTWSELEDLADRCESYRERKHLSEKFEELERRVEKLERAIDVGYANSAVSDDAVNVM